MNNKDKNKILKSFVTFKCQGSKGNSSNNHNIIASNNFNHNNFKSKPKKLFQTKNIAKNTQSIPQFKKHVFVNKKKIKFITQNFQRKCIKNYKEEAADIAKIF